MSFLSKRRFPSARSIGRAAALLVMFASATSGAGATQWTCRTCRETNPPDSKFCKGCTQWKPVAIPSHLQESCNASPPAEKKVKVKHSWKKCKCIRNWAVLIPCGLCQERIKAIESKAIRKAQHKYQKDIKKFMKECDVTRQQAEMLCKQPGNNSSANIRVSDFQQRLQSYVKVTNFDNDGNSLFRCLSYEFLKDDCFYHWYRRRIMKYAALVACREKSFPVQWDQSKGAHINIWDTMKATYEHDEINKDIMDGWDGWLNRNRKDKAYPDIFVLMVAQVALHVKFELIDCAPDSKLNRIDCAGPPDFRVVGLLRVNSQYAHLESTGFHIRSVDAANLISLYTNRRRRRLVVMERLLEEIRRAQ